MAAVVREILLCLFLAALLGVAIGWLARGLRARRRALAEAAISRRAMEEMRAQLRVIESARQSDQRTLEELQSLASAGRTQAETLRRALKDADGAREAARNEAASSREQLTNLEAQLREAEAARDAAKSEAEAARSPVPGGRARVAELEDPRHAARRESAQGEGGRTASAVVDEATRQRFETIRATLRAAENGWDAARGQAEAALQQLGASRRQLAASEDERDALAAQVAESQAELLQLHVRLEAAQAPILPVESLLATTPAEQAAPEGKPLKPVHDDLRKIRGIGPVAEKTLHRAGIYRYAQIAVWTADDIASMGKRLPGFHDRIVRDRWAATARRLHIAKYGSPP
jgi:predicted flap endonuclease-1-like 5' DNA nuclease